LRRAGKTGAPKVPHRDGAGKSEGIKLFRFRSCSL
jgi:hypothetical protein